MKKKNHKKIIIFHIFILVVFFIFWFISTLYFNSNDAFAIVNDDHNASNSVMPALHTPLLKDKSIKGEFTAQENNLGIVAVRFYTFHRINKDVVRFLIKEQGAKNWYYEQTYKVNQFQWDNYFTFGFPIINNSKGKHYIFEIISLHGTRYDAITLSRIQPVLETKYQFNKSQIFSSPNKLVYYIYKKFLNSISNTDYIVSSLVYAIPFFIYLWTALIWYIFRDHPIFERIKEIHGTVIILQIIILLNILFVQHLTSDFAIYIILGVWLVAVLRYKLEGKINFFFAFLLILGTPIALALNDHESAEQAAIWSFYFILFGLLQQMWELNFKTKDLVTLSSFLKKMNIFKEYK